MPERSFKNSVRIAVPVILVIFFSFAHPFGLYFLNDDFSHIPLAISGNFLHSNFLRPVADLTLWLDGWVWQKNPAGFHLTNLTIHLANTFLSFLLYKKIFENAGRQHAQELAALTAALFLVYSFHSESIFWIIGRGGSLAAFFILISLNGYFYSKRTASLIISLLSFAIGLFTYEFVWILPVVILVLQVREFRRHQPVNWRWTFFFAVSFLVYLVTRMSMHGVFISDYEGGSLINFKISNLVRNYTATVIRCFVPPFSNSHMFVIGSVIFGLAAGGLLLRQRKKFQSALLLPLFLLLVSCLPSISLGIDTHDSEGDRFLYVPSLFACWFIAELLFLSLPSNGLKTAALLGVISIHAILLIGYAGDYRYAGRVARQSIDCLAQAYPARKLVAAGLPMQIGGALIFRSGFQEALAWMLPGRYTTVEIISKMELFRKDGYRCVTGQPVRQAGPRFISWTDNNEVVIR